MSTKCPVCKRWVAVNDHLRVSRHDEPELMRFCAGSGWPLLVTYQPSERGGLR
jgi:hypothetical protein